MIKKLWSPNHQQHILKRRPQVKEPSAFAVRYCSNTKESLSSSIREIEGVVHVSEIWSVSAARLDDGTCRQ
jgi:type III secretory pathway lipoprotein EscJ